MSTRTKSAQLREHLVAMIAGELGPHDQLPTERELAETLSVSRLTVRRVLDRMEAEGKVYRIQGAGTFVSEPRIAKSIELTSFSEDMRQRGLKPGTRVLSTAEVMAGAHIGYALGISPGDRVHYIVRLRTADDAPMCLEKIRIPAYLAPGLLQLSLEGSLYETLASDFNIELERADQEIRCTVLEPEDAELLQVPTLSPAFAVERTVFDARGRAIEHAAALYRGDRYSYRMNLLRPQRASSD